MKALIAPSKQSTLLLGDIQRHMVKSRAFEDSRRTDVLHPSDMAKDDWCPRRSAYTIHGVETEVAEEVPFHQLLAIFEEGHDIHAKWQRWLGEMGLLWGKWKCPGCKAEYLGTGGLDCAQCSQPMRYVEVPLDAEDDWLVHGHADGAIESRASLIEVKSIGPGTLRIDAPDVVKANTHKTVGGMNLLDVENIWKEIKRPFLSHRKQLGIYLAIAQKTIPWDVEWGVFLYEFKATQSTKEFKIRADALIKVAEPLLEKAKEVKDAVAAGTPEAVARPEDFHIEHKVCKKCPFFTTCYAEDTTNGTGHAEQNTPDGEDVAGSQESDGPATDPQPSHARRRLPAPSGRSDGSRRQRIDVAVRDADQVGRVPQHPTRDGRGRREVRRRVPRAIQGDQDALQRQREDGHADEGQGVGGPGVPGSA